MAAIDLLRVLGGYGPAYVAIAFWGRPHPQNVAVPSVVSAPDPGTFLDRGPIPAEQTALDLRGVERELDRAIGQDAYEPGN